MIPIIGDQSHKESQNGAFHGPPFLHPWRPWPEFVKIYDTLDSQFLDCIKPVRGLVRELSGWSLVPT